MDARREQTHYMKRIVLPSGKTIEVGCFKDPDAPALRADEPPKAPQHPPAEPHQHLHVCIVCSSELVYPFQWEESGPGNWSVLLHCPNCDVYREGVFSQVSVDAFDEQLDRGADALTRAYKRLMRANMADEIERFVCALNADAILPEDI
jgi:hypothetical protein